MRSEALRHLYLGTIISFGLRIVGTGIMFCALLLLARALPTDEFGLYIYLVDLIALAAPVVSLGLAQICVRVVSDAVSSSTPAAIYLFRNAAVGFMVLSSFAFWAILEGAKHFGLLPIGMREEVLPLSVLLLVSIASLRLMQEMLRASRYIVLSQIVEQVIWPIALAALATFALFGMFAAPVAFIVGAQSLLMIVAAIMLFFAFERYVMRSLIGSAGSPPIGQLREWLMVGLPLAFSGGLSVIQYRGDVVVLGACVSQSDLGAYAAAVRLAGLIIFALGATAATIEPLLRQYFTSGETANLQMTVDRSAVLSVLMALPVAGPLLFFPTLFLSLFGGAFTAASTALQILAIGQIVNALTGPISPLIIALGLQRANLAVMIVTTTLMVIGLIIVVPIFGTTGAATMVALNAISLNCALSLLIFVRSGIKTFVRPTGIFVMITDINSKIGNLKTWTQNRFGYYND